MKITLFQFSSVFAIGIGSSRQSGKGTAFYALLEQTYISS